MSQIIDGNSPPFTPPKTNFGTEFASSSDEMKPIEKKVYDLSPIISKLETQKSRSITILGWHEQILLETYKSELIKRLPYHRKKVEEILCRRIRDSNDLQSELLSMREKCISLFKDFNKPHFFLDFGIKPTYFDTLPDLVSLYKKIEESPDPTEANIRQFYEELTVYGSFAKALEVARKVSNEFFLDDAYLHISSHMAAWGNPQEIEALQLANAITDTKKKEVAFHNISFNLAIKGKYESAMTLAGILSDYENQNVISLIALLFAIRNRLDQAIQLVETITDPSKKDWAYCDIAIELGLESLLDKIQTVSIKDHAISEISLFYAEAGKVDEAMKLSSTITDPSKRTFTTCRIAIEEGIKLVNKDTDFAAIARVLLKQGHLKEAIRLAEEIDDRYIKDYISRDIAIALAMNDQCEKAALLASSISDPMNKDTAFSAISIIFAKKGELDKAVQLGEMITEELLQGFSYWKISKHMKSKEAISLCNKITHKMYRHMATVELKGQEPS